MTLFVFCGVFSLCLSSVWKGNRGIQIFLPGTQPGQADTSMPVSRCLPCHRTQVREWAGSTTAQALRDPIFNAMLSITSKHTMPLGLDVGDHCLRCHAPSSWIAGRSHSMSIDGLRGSDLDGVHCDFCHRLVDPLSPGPHTIVADSVSGYGNGMYAIQKFSTPLRGSRGVAHPCEPTAADSFYKSSEYCGVCHDESNPYLSMDADRTAPYRQIPLERTFSEWKLSWFATRGEAGTCQSCHMARYQGAASSIRGSQQRLDIASHDFAGSNTLAQQAVLQCWQGLDAGAVRENVRRTEDLLATSARIEIAAGRKTNAVQLLVRITNLTGHKLPTGFLDGKRMWLSITGQNALRQTIFTSGAYDYSTGDIQRDYQAKVYEARAGASVELAERIGIERGVSFIDALADTIYFDNRIPPRGFTNGAFQERRAEPVGSNYDDGQYWDITEYSLPQGVANVEVKLCYQVVSGEFIRFLHEENEGNSYDLKNWGDKSLAAWKSFGAPLIIASREAVVGGTPPFLPAFTDLELPLQFRLEQNFPNPFNGSSTIRFWLSEPTQVFLALYDIMGREVLVLVDETVHSGPHSVLLQGLELSSGMYFYSLAVKGKRETKKLLFIK